MLPSQSKNTDSILYRVKLGDNISTIIRHYYGPLNFQKQNVIIKQIQQDNPEITNPNRIFPGQALLIDLPTQHYAVPASNPSGTIMARKEESTPFSNN